MNVQANIGFKYKEHLGLMQLSELLPAVGELIPYEYAAIRKPEYDRLIANILSSATPQRTPRFVQIGGIPGAGKTTFAKMPVGTNSCLLVLTRLWKRCPATKLIFIAWGLWKPLTAGKCRPE